MAEFSDQGSLVSEPGASMVGKYFGGTAVVGLCLATPACIIALMMLDVPMNPMFLIAAGICAAIGLVFAIGAQNDESRMGGGPPEDED